MLSPAEDHAPIGAQVAPFDALARGAVQDLDVEGARECVTVPERDPTCRRYTKRQASAISSYDGLIKADRTVPGSLLMESQSPNLERNRTVKVECFA